MSTIEVAVAGRGIQVKQGYEKPSAGDVNTCAVSLAIESGGVWDGLPHKRVTFSTRTASVTVDYAPTIAIPHEVMASPGALYLTLTGYDADGIEVARTHRMTYPIEVARAGADEGAEPTPATLDVVSRIDNLAADLEEKRDTDYWRGEPGKDGAPGEPGADGYSPTASVTKNGGTATITVTDKNGTTTATVSDGAPGSDANVTKENVEAALGYEPLKGLAVAGKEIIPVGGIVDLPDATSENKGIVGVNTAYGIGYNKSLPALIIIAPPNSQIDKRNTTWNRNYLAVTIGNIDYAVKAAMTDGKGASWTADEQQAARERMNAADANKVYIMQKQIENLQGIVATEETDSTEAYTKTVPTGAQKWASLDKVGGKTVVWNQLERPKKFNYSRTEFSASASSSNMIEVVANSYLDTSFGDNVFSSDAAFVAEHKFFVDAPVYLELYFKAQGVQVNPGGRIFTATVTSTYSNISFSFNNCKAGTYRFLLCVHDLTQMFGSGNEPTSLDDPRIAFIKAYAEAHPEYNPGELMSAEVVEVESKGTFPIQQSVRDMCPGYGWSAGTVCNEIDFERKVYVQRVGSVDLGTLDWTRYSNGRMQAYTTSHTHVNSPYELVSNCVCSKYIATSAAIIESNSPVDKTVALGGNINTFTVYDSDYTDANTFKAAMQGVILYYELAEPIEVDLSDVLSDDHYIEVEAGGTVTFKQASTQLPVPSSVTYQISTSEVIANA